MRPVRDAATSAARRAATLDRVVAAAPLWIALLYVVAIDLKGIWTDEGIRYSVMSGGLTWAEYNVRGSFAGFADVLRAVGHSLFQPLYHLLANALLRLTGSHSELLLRGLNIVLLVAALKGLLRLFRREPPAVRLFALAIFGLNGFLFMHVLQVREYTLYLALFIWSSCFAFDLVELPEAPSWRRSWPTIVAYGLLAALLFYSHVYSVFALAAQAVVLAWPREHRAARLRAAAVAYGIAAALAAPWIVATFLHFPTKLHPGAWDGRPATWTRLADSFRHGFESLLAFDRWDVEAWLRRFVIALLLGVVLSWVASLRSKDRLDRRAPYALLTMVLLAAFQAVFFFTYDPFSTWARYFVGYYVGYALLATCAFADLHRRAGRRGGRPAVWLARGVLVSAVAVGLFQFNLYYHAPYMDTAISSECNWRRTGREMAEHIRAGETVAYYSPLLAWTIGVSWPAFPLELSFDRLLGDDPPRPPRLWVLDTSVARDSRDRVLNRLAKRGYRLVETVEMSCRCRLLRHELDDAAAPPGS